jgi:electron transport complex protein RnfE
MKNYWHELTKGILRENPLFIIVLGTCPSLAITTTVENGIGMGLAATFVLICSNVFISMLRKIIPKQVRIPAFIVVIASFVTIADLVLHAYAYSLWKALGIFIPLIVVNCIILGRAEAFAQSNTVLSSFMDGVGMGIGFTLALILMSSIREILGNGTFLGAKVFGDGFDPAVMMVMPPGGFLTLGFLIAVVNVINKRMKERNS